MDGMGKHKSSYKYTESSHGSRPWVCEKIMASRQRVPTYLYLPPVVVRPSKAGFKGNQWVFIKPLLRRGGVRWLGRGGNRPRLTDLSQPRLGQHRFEAREFLDPKVWDFGTFSFPESNSIFAFENGWLEDKTSLSYWVSAYFQGQTVSFKGGQVFFW